MGRDWAAAAESLASTSSALRSRADELCGAIAIHAERGRECSAVLQHAHSDRERLKTEGSTLRSEHRLLAEIESARRLLGSADLALLARCLGMLENVARRSFPDAAADASLDALRSLVEGGGRPLSATAFDGLRETAAELAADLEAAWRAWLGSSSAAALFQGARALALQPPGNLSAGLDGLETERRALDDAKGCLSSAERADALSALVGGGRAGQPGRALRACHRMLRDDAAARLTAELEVSVRLAAHALDDSAGASVLPALAEAAASAAKAARAVASLFGSLPPPSADEEAAADEAAAAAASVKELAGETDTLLAAMRKQAADADGPRAAALTRLGRDASALLRRQLDAAPAMARASMTLRGRRVVSILGEANEQLEQAALVLPAE